MMSTKLNVETFIAVLKKSGLVDRDRLEEALSDYFKSGGSTDDPLPLVDRLIAANLLTKWQSEKLLQGKHRGYFLGKYKLLSLLGKGGMSSVYLAEHLLMRRRCALKVLPAKRVDDSSYLERFHREAQAVALLDHPNIVRAYDVDHQVDGDRQIHFLVMEHVDGLSLQELVTEKGVVSFLDAAEYTRQAAAGLQDAHDHGMVHRDIKPGNLLVDQNGIVKILDLGLARFFTSEEGNEALTIRHDEKVLGTADYLSPEQAIDSHTVDARADIYSLGCTLYFLLTGQPPFTEGTLAQRLMAHQIKTPPTVESLRTDTPDGLAAILRKMMEKQAGDRFPKAGDVEKALFKWIDENADGAWRSAHSSVYGSRILNSEATPKAVPVAKPVVAVVLKPQVRTPEPPRVSPANPSSLDLDLLDITTPSAAETDSAMSQFLSTLAQPKSDVKPPKPASNPSIKVPTKSLPDDMPPDLLAAITTPASTAIPAAGFPVFDPHDFSRSAVVKTVEPPKSKSGVATASRPAPTGLWKTSWETWNQLSSSARIGSGVGVCLVVLLAIYMLGGFGGRPGTPPPDGRIHPFPVDKREIIVGPKAEFTKIRDALIAVRHRFQPDRGNNDRFVVKILAGTYDEKLRIDGSVKHWPEGVTLLGDGEVILKSSGDESVLRLINVSRFTIENIQIDAASKPIAIEVADDLHETHLKNLVIRGFTGVGLKCKGGQGLSFGDSQFLLEQLTFEPAAEASQATAIRLEEGAENDVNSIHVRGCRFLGPLAAGIAIQGRSPYGLEISECVFDHVIDGIRIEGFPTLKSIHVTNNSFRRSRAGIRFENLPSVQSTELMFRRNLFVNTDLAEAIVQDGFDDQKFRAMLSTTPAGIEHNWSDRPTPTSPAPGELLILFENGKTGEQGLAFASTDPKSPKFLAPTEKSPQKAVGEAQPFENKWVGAIGP